MSEQSEREHRQKYYTAIRYACDPCGFAVSGHSSDPQEAPWLYCPNCDHELEIEVDYE